jgi:trigger factor
LGWANVKRHVASEITLLCDDHHREKTAGFLPNQRVIEANQRPFNAINGVTAPYTLHYSGREFSLVIGSYVFEGTDRGSGAAGQAIRIDGESLFGVRLEDGHFLLNLSVYDSDDNLVLRIVDNELVLNVCSWDIEVVGARITIRQGRGNILFDIVFRPPSSVAVLRGRFLYHGVELFVAPKWCALLNNRLVFSGLGIRNCLVGLNIGDDPDSVPSGIRIDGIQRGDWDREDAIRWVRAAAAAKSPQVKEAVDELLDTEEFD